ncbi:hypothetical protein [Sphingomonas sp.]|uniref:hypothetical protein n=1 Tax=Sphingomonas sp. TaxID=28214 RepID=UPI0025E13CDF|nr:hypothetical protein [Sphingomonas sp.]
MGEEPGDAKRYEISCQGTATEDDGRSHSESFTWIVDESAPASEQIFHNGKSVCEGATSCSVEIKPYHIRIRTAHERTESGRKSTVEFDVTVNRVSGIAKGKGFGTETQGNVVKQHSMEATFSCDKYPFKRVI